MSIGNKIWVISGGHIPLHSTGEEPAFTSRDVLCLLNTHPHEVRVRLTIYYEDKEPVGPYPIELTKNSVRQVRFNDLVDPFPIPLDTNYAAVVESEHPIFVQFTRIDTSGANMAMFSTMAFPADT